MVFLIVQVAVVLGVSSALLFDIGGTSVCSSSSLLVVLAKNSCFVTVQLFASHRDGHFCHGMISRFLV